MSEESEIETLRKTHFSTNSRINNYRRYTLFRGRGWWRLKPIAREVGVSTTTIASWGEERRIRTKEDPERALQRLYNVSDARREAAKIKGR